LGSKDDGGLMKCRAAMLAVLTSIAVSGFGQADDAAGPAGSLVKQFIESSARGECSDKKWEQRFTPQALEEIKGAVGSFEGYCKAVTQWHAKVESVEIARDRPTGRPDERWVRYLITFVNGEMQGHGVYLIHDEEGWKWSHIETRFKQGGTAPPRVQLKVGPSPTPP